MQLFLNGIIIYNIYAYIYKFISEFAYSYFVFFILSYFYLDRFDYRPEDRKILENT